MALARILASDANLGCRHLIERQPELVHVHETANTRFVTDLDTVEDVRRLASARAGDSNFRAGRSRVQLGSVPRSLRDFPQP